MKKLFYICLVLPVFVFGSDVQTDILPRSVNFLIFVAIMYYILADKARAYFTGRTASIEDEFAKIDRQKLANKKKITDANKELEKAKLLAGKIVDEATANIDNIKLHIKKATDEKIAQLVKKTDENITIQTQRLKNQTIDKFIDDIFASQNIKISAKDIVNIINKKVA